LYIAPVTIVDLFKRLHLPTNNKTTMSNKYPKGALANTVGAMGNIKTRV